MGNLPLEVLHIVLSYVKESDRRHSLRNCSLVCKLWNQPSQLLLFSKVVIKHEIKLKSFVKIIENNKQLSNVVKELQLDIKTRRNPYRDTPNYEDSTFEQLLNYLPKLEIFGSNHRVDYLTIIDALIDFKLPHLKRLTVLPLVEEDLDYYGTCVRLMRDRIENLVLANTKTVSNIRDRATYRYANANLSKEVDRSFDRLYNNLEEFPKVKEVLITVNTNDPIGILESVTEECLNLQRIRFDIAYNHIRHAYTLNKIQNFTPRPNIKILHGIQLQFNNSNILLYIMHKFPQLQFLYLDAKYKDEPKVLPNQITQQFLTYLTTINTVSIHGLCLKLDDVSDAIESFWRNKLNARNKILEIKYGGCLDDVVELDFTRHSIVENRISVEYNRETGDVLEHTKLMKNCGELFRTVAFKNSSNLNLPSNTPELAKAMFYGNIISHAINNCPNLIDLDVVKFELKEIDFSQFVLSDHKIRFRTLCIIKSKVKNSVFRDLSSAFTAIKELKLIHNQYYFDEHTDRINADLNMINTAIQVLTIDFGNQKTTRAIFKIFISQWNEYRYFKCGRDGVVQRSHKDEYDDKRDFLFHLRCKSLGRLVMRCTDVSKS